VEELSRACRSAALAVALAVAGSNGLGMTPPATPNGRCHVSNGAKLPAASGGSVALCAAIERAAEALGKQVFTVRIDVGPRSRLTAYVTLADGRSLSPLRMAVMDGAIGKATLERFGAAVANHVAGATR
jgi:hypothetical protein